MPLAKKEVSNAACIFLTAIMLHACVTAPARASEGTTAIMPIKAGVVQCGQMHDMERMCADDPRCCVFLEPAAGEYSTPIEDAGRAVTTTCELWRRPDGTAAIPVCIRSHE